MTDVAYQAIRDAINLARAQQIRHLPALKSALLQRGYPEQTVNEALQAWANYEVSKREQVL
jgi:hypothetical protein